MQAKPLPPLRGLRKQWRLIQMGLVSGFISDFSGFVFCVSLSPLTCGMWSNQDSKIPYTNYAESSVNVSGPLKQTTSPCVVVQLAVGASPKSFDSSALMNFEVKGILGAPPCIMVQPAHMEEVRQT